MKKKAGFLIPLFFIAILTTFVFYFYDFNEEENEPISFHLSVDEYSYDEILDYQDGYFLVRNEDNYQIINEKNQFIDTIEYAYHEVLLLEKGFYVDKTLDGEYLKRNGELVSKITLESDSLLYEQEDDFIYYTNYDSYLSDGIVNVYDYDTKNISSFLFDIETGEKIKEFQGEIKPLKDGYYFVNEEDKSTLLQIKEEMQIQNDYLFTGTYNDQYILVYQDDKYGIIDYEGDIVLDIIYDDVKFEESNYFAVLENGWYGVVNNMGEILIPFEYENIELLNNYILTEKDNQIHILNKEGKDLDLSYNIVNEYDWIELENVLILELNNEDYSSVIIKENEEVFALNLDDKVGVIDDSFILINTLNKDNSNTLSFYDSNNNKKSAFRIIVNGDYECTRVNKNIVKMIDEEKTLYFDIENEQSLEEVSYEVKRLDNNYLYYISDEMIYLLDDQYQLLDFINGMDLEVINDSYYKVKNKDGKYQFLSISK